MAIKIAFSARQWSSSHSWANRSRRLLPLPEGRPDRFGSIGIAPSRPCAPTLAERTEIMVRFDSNDRLVQALGADLTPVRRLAPPGLRVLLWLAIVGAVALALMMVSDVEAMIG